MAVSYSAYLKEMAGVPEDQLTEEDKKKRRQQAAKRRLARLAKNGNQ